MSPLEAMALIAIAMTSALLLLSCGSGSSPAPTPDPPPSSTGVGNSNAGPGPASGGPGAPSPNVGAIPPSPSAFKQYEWYSRTFKVRLDQELKIEPGVVNEEPAFSQIIDATGYWNADSTCTVKVLADSRFIADRFLDRLKHHIEGSHLGVGVSPARASRDSGNRKN